MRLIESFFNFFIWQPLAGFIAQNKKQDTPQDVLPYARFYAASTMYCVHVCPNGALRSLIFDIIAAAWSPLTGVG